MQHALVSVDGVALPRGCHHYPESRDDWVASCTPLAWCGAGEALGSLKGFLSGILEANAFRIVGV